MRLIFIIFFFFAFTVKLYSQIDTIYLENGSIESIGETKDGKQVGVWYSNFKNDTPYCVTTYLNHNKLIFEEYKSVDFSQDIYIESRIIVPTIIENNSKCLFRQTYVKQKKDSTKSVTGKIFYYYPNGTIAKQCKLRNGYHHGKLKIYYKNGNIGNILYLKDNVNHGKFKTYYENGKLMIKGRYNHDARKGKWQEFYENGQLKLIGKYCTDIDPIEITRENKFQILEMYPYLENEIIYIGRIVDFKSGMWRYFDEKGILIKMEKYEHGILVETTVY